MTTRDANLYLFVTPDVIYKAHLRFLAHGVSPLTDGRSWMLRAMCDLVEYFVFHSPRGWLTDGMLTIMDAHGHHCGLANYPQDLLGWN